MMVPVPVSDEEVNAYVDGALNAADAAEVGARLARHPAAAARAEAIRALTNALHAYFDAVLDEKPPPRLAATLRVKGKEKAGISTLSPASVRVANPRTGRLAEPDRENRTATLGKRQSGPSA